MKLDGDSYKVTEIYRIPSVSVERHKVSNKGGKLSQQSPVKIRALGKRRVRKPTG